MIRFTLLSSIDLGFTFAGEQTFFLINYLIIQILSKNQENDVAAVIVEPIQSEGGDNYADAEFFQV